MTDRPPAAGRVAATAPVRTVFFGSGAFGLPILDALRSLALVNLVAVVSTPDRPAGRGERLRATPVAEHAGRLGLPILRPGSLRTPDATAEIAATAPDVAILADYGRIVPPSVLDIPSRGFLNLHPSLLPRHRGATPIAGAILAGDAETGVTLFRMDAGLDTGPILAQVAWPLSSGATADAVEADAAARAADLVESALSAWLAGELPERPQDDAAATMTRPLRREDGRLDPHQPAAQLERRVRALVPWPGTFVETPELRLVVSGVAVAPSQPGDRPDTLVADDDGIALATIDGRLRLLEVRPAGRRMMTGAELRRGRPGLVGQALVRPAPMVGAGRGS